MNPYTPTSLQVLDPKNAPGAFQYADDGQASMVPPPTPIMTLQQQPAAATPVSAPMQTTSTATQPNVMGELDRIRQEALRIQGMIPGSTTQTANAGFVAPGLETDYPSYQELYPEVDQNKIYRQTLKQFQSQINATNQVYDQLLNEARLQGTGRLGTQRAAAARGGLIGSDFGMAQEEQVRDLNFQDQQAVQAQRNAAIGAIMGTVRQTAVDEAKSKREAIQQGAENYISYLKSSRERKLNNLTTVAKAMLLQGIDPNTMSPDELKAVADEGGLNVNDIITQYNIAKSESESASAEADLKTRKTEAEIAKMEADTANAGYFELSEGQSRYDAQGNIIASKGKTYAPGTGSGSSLDLTGDNKRTLLGGGWNESEISSLQDGVKQYGLQTVIEQEKAAGATPSQIAALEKAYKAGTEDGNAFLTTDYFKSLFGDEKLKQAAKEAGTVTGGDDFIPFNESGDTTTYLNQLMSTVELYRQAGYTDQEILKMMQ